MHVRRTVYSMLQISLILSRQNYRTSGGSSKGLPVPSACFSDETITRSQGPILVSVIGKFGTYHPEYREERVVNMVMWYVCGKLPTPYGYRFIWRVGSRYWREGLVRYYRRSCIVIWIHHTSNVHVMWTQDSQHLGRTMDLLKNLRGTMVWSECFYHGPHLGLFL